MSTLNLNNQIFDKKNNFFSINKFQELFDPIIYMQIIKINTLIVVDD